MLHVYRPPPPVGDTTVTGWEPSAFGPRLRWPSVIVKDRGLLQFQVYFRTRDEHPTSPTNGSLIPLHTYA